MLFRFTVTKFFKLFQILRYKSKFIETENRSHTNYKSVRFTGTTILELLNLSRLEPCIIMK